jgi:carbamoyl-phosphate synthase / aspartate carbamoyltransferase / dihydroorotase
LKLYLDQTYGPLRLDEMTLWQEHFKAWPKTAPGGACRGAQPGGGNPGIGAGRPAAAHRPCRGTREEILLVRAAKERGFKVTCEVTPHHLFLTADDLPGGWGEVRPRLGTQADVDALWANLDVIDCFATDHAPHTAAEKASDNPPPGFPGLETALPLLLTAVHEGRLTLDDVITRMADNVRRIFGVPSQPETWVEVDLDAEHTLSAQGMQGKAGWTPFEGHGRCAVRCGKVVLRGQTVYQDGRVLAQPGSWAANQVAYKSADHINNKMVVCRPGCLRTLRKLKISTNRSIT